MVETLLLLYFQTLEECKVLSESQIDVVSFLEEQIEHTDRFCREAALSDREEYAKSILQPFTANV